MNAHPQASQPSHQHFGQTRWSLIEAVQNATPAAAPLTELARQYDFAVYASLRADGWPPAAARALCERFLDALPEILLQHPPGRCGRFRVYLLDRLKAYLQATGAQPGTGIWPAEDQATAALEARLRQESAAGAVAFDRSFALQVIRASLARLREEAAGLGHAGLFERLEPYLTRDPDEAAWLSLAAELGMARLALQLALRRLRQRFREFVEAELAETVSDAEALLAERASLWQALVQRP